MSFAILNSPVATELDRAMRVDERVVRRERLEFVRRGDERQAGHRRNALGEEFCELRLGIQPGADRGAALRQRIERFHRLAQTRHAGLHLRGIAGEFLAERERRRILRMGAADFHDFREFLFLLLQRRMQMRERRQQPLRDLFDRRDMHRGRKGIVRRLAHVDVIVRMHRLLRALRCRPAFRWRGSRSPRWRSCSTGCRSRSARRRAENDRRACRRSPPALPSRSSGRSSLSSEPSSMLVSAAARLTMPSARTSGFGMRFAADAEIVARALVCAPQ